MALENQQNIFVVYNCSIEKDYLKKIRENKKIAIFLFKLVQNAGHQRRF